MPQLRRFLASKNFISAGHMELKRVVITGMGALTPLGNSVNDYWNGLINGVSGADYHYKVSMPQNSKQDLPVR